VFELFGFWPFDFSCSGFLFITFMVFMWLVWSVTSVAKKVVESDTAKEVGTSLLGDWLWSWLRK
jgi:hypothetical protein